MSVGNPNNFFKELEDRADYFDDKELEALVTDLAKLFRRRAWCLAKIRDNGEWREKRDAFKQKWFTQHGREERIEGYLAEIADEVRDMFGMNQKYCKECKHWEKRNEEYGDCYAEEHYIMHRSKSCEKWEEKHDEC